MADVINQKLNLIPQSNETCALDDAKIFSTPIDDDIIKRLQEWPSLGHYILHRLDTVSADKTIYVSMKFDRKMNITQ